MYLFFRYELLIRHLLVQSIALYREDVPCNSVVMRFSNVHNKMILFTRYFPTVVQHSSCKFYLLYRMTILIYGLFITLIG